MANGSTIANSMIAVSIGMAIAPLIEKSSRKAREPELIQIKQISTIAARWRRRVLRRSRAGMGAVELRARGCGLIEINLSGPPPRQAESWKPPEELP